MYVSALKECVTPFPSMKVLEWKKFNEFLGGFRVREFTCFCAPTGAGKTQLLSNISSQLLQQKIKHFVMSVETGPTDYVKRIMSAMSGVEYNSGDAIPIEVLRDFDLKFSQHFASDLIYLALYDNRVPLTVLVDSLKKMQSLGYNLAILDNLNFFMEVSSQDQSIVEMDKVIHALIILCKQIDIHIIMVMHPRKTVDGQVVSEYDIKGSSTAVQEAHNVLLMNRPTDLEIEKLGVMKHDRKLTFKKLRHRGKYVNEVLWLSYRNGRYNELTI